jgi:hypothetical protein
VRALFRDCRRRRNKEAGPATMINADDPVTGQVTTLGHRPNHYTIFYALYVQVDNAQS